jgi:hypothetical protein
MTIPSDSGSAEHGGPALRIPHTSGAPHGMGRHVNHDPASRRFAFRAPPKVDLRAVRHERHVSIFDQGALGSCTGNAAVGCMATGEFYATITEADADWLEPLDQGSAVRCYSDATAIDPWPGTYPPTDTGSDGLSVAKVLKAAGAISGYVWAFSLEDALAALMDRPLITGTLWLNDMFQPSADGLVTPGGSIAGGHEYVIDEYDPVRGWIGFTNSWSAYWGKSGRFYMEAEKYGALLARDGDVTSFVPIVEPAPVPVTDKATAADRRMWNVVERYATKKGGMFSSTAQRREALRNWRATKDWS